MKIISLKAENFQNLKCVEIKPDGSLVRLSGKNGAGKSSVLDAIEVVLRGAKAIKSVPIRRGEKRAEIIAETDKWVAHRIITEKGTQLVVRTPDGKATFNSPQSLLDQVWGELTFDPLAFLLKSPPEQYKILMKLVGLEFTELDAKRKEMYDERSGANRDLKRVQMSLEGIPEPRETLEDGTPLQEISVTELDAKKTALQEQYRRHTEYIGEREIATKDLLAAEDRLNLAKQHVQQCEASVQVQLAVLDTLKGNPVSLPAEDIDQITDKIRTASEQNRRIQVQLQKNVEYGNAQEAIKRVTYEADHLTAGISAIDEGKVSQIKKARFPLDGLSMGEETVLFRGTPMDQLSTGEAIRVSTAMAIALNPSLKVIFIRNASLLDSSGLKIVADLAEQHGYQVWVEQMDETGTVGIYLEDGSVVRDNHAKKEPAEAQA